MKRFLLILLACLVLSCGMKNKTYYIDYADGNDTADGLTPQTAWKHCPGDTDAADAVKDHAPAPGDIYLFKGGIAYHGSIRLKASGAESAPIVLDGNSDDTYGTGPAVLDGGRVITGWQRCGTAEEARGNPLWKDIFYADEDLDISRNFNHGEVVLHRQVPTDKMAPWQRVILIDGARQVLPIAQYPKPRDPFYPDRPGDFLKSENRLIIDEKKGVSVIRCGKELRKRGPDYFKGMFLGVHGGNNHTYFAAVLGYDPRAHQVTFPGFKHKTYKTTQYAFYNSPLLIEHKGEWSVTPLPDGKTRFHLLADRLVDGLPDNIGFPVLKTGVQIAEGASHIAVKGFLIQRYSGGGGGVSVAGGAGKPRSGDVLVQDCEIRFLTGHAGVGLNHCDGVTVDNCYVHHCPGWTTAVFLSRVNDYSVKGCCLDKNSGSGIRHYECKRGTIDGNTILNHYGMHSTTINVYEGCEDLVIENNYMHNTMAVNRNAKNITFRNNLLDTQHRNMMNIAFWISGSVGGRDIDNIYIEKNTFINLSAADTWESSVFIQTKDGVTSPTSIVARNNIFDRLRMPVPDVVEENIFMRETDRTAAGKGSVMESDPAKLFRDPANGDYRRKEGGPLMAAGANVPLPVAWRRNRPRD